MRKSLWIVVVMALFVVVSAPAAHADSFTVSGTFDDGSVLTGTLTIDAITGLITASDVSTTGTFVSGPFAVQTQAPGKPNYLASMQDPAGDVLFLVFAAANLIGYTGGPLCDTSCGLPTEIFPLAGGELQLTSGSVAPAITPAPEPGSLALIFFGLAALLAMRKRIGCGRQASAA